MSIIMRRIFLCIIGMIAGLAAWPFAETTLLFQPDFPSYLIFSIFLGVIFGFVMGGFFGTSDGVIMSVKRSVFSGSIHGALIGIIGGAVGFIIGQAALFIAGNILIQSAREFNTVGFPVSRAVGWAFLGVFIGMVDGIRSRSFDKIKVGIIGGILGGFLGGLALEYSRLVVNNVMFARVAGLIIFGLFIGLLYGFVESRLSFGVLRLLNGKYKGKEFLVNQRKIKIGSSVKNTIVLSGYDKISDTHAELKVKGDTVVIKKNSPKTVISVNDDKVEEHQLIMDDVIQIGSAKFLYKFK
ncbi:MAG: FHA domain-containing protein [Spirochaetes bacterium]|nr:FHA domain-containing protein [Spirochaetota bacterium]